MSDTSPFVRFSVRMCETLTTYAPSQPPPPPCAGAMRYIGSRPRHTLSTRRGFPSSPTRRSPSCTSCTATTLPSASSTGVSRARHLP